MFSFPSDSDGPGRGQTRKLVSDQFSILFGSTSLRLQVPTSNMNFECGLPTTSARIAGFEVDHTNPYLLPSAQPETLPGRRLLGAVYVAQ
jgi:hypothetical protein